MYDGMIDKISKTRMWIFVLLLQLLNQNYLVGEMTRLAFAAHNTNVVNIFS